MVVRWAFLLWFITKQNQSISGIMKRFIAQDQFLHLMAFPFGLEKAILAMLFLKVLIGMTEKTSSLKLALKE